MTIDEFKEHLRRNPGTVLRFQMPDGGLIPVAVEERGGKVWLKDVKHGGQRR